MFCAKSQNDWTNKINEIEERYFAKFEFSTSEISWDSILRIPILHTTVLFNQSSLCLYYSSSTRNSPRWYMTLRYTRLILLVRNISSFIDLWYWHHFKRWRQVLYVFLKIQTKVENMHGIFLWLYLNVTWNIHWSVWHGYVWISSQGLFIEKVFAR